MQCREIRQTVYSVLNQTSSDYELIVIDDGSTDRTLDILTELSITNSQLIVIHTENHGSGPARNIGIDHSNGEWLYFPDSDDELDVNTVKFLTEITQGSNYDTVVFGYKLAKGNRIIREKTYKDIVIDGSDMRKNYVPFYSMNAEYGIQGAPWNKLFSSELVKKNGVYFPPLRRHQDDGFISLYMQFASKICFSSKVLYTYNENSIDDILRKYPIDYYASVEGL
ncbi:MAG: glycosyltransferase family 2 protein, partial [Acholeplasma sp.]|nr:glycosyltransferase family 2 protein [Acholeplasma sp.]